MKFLILIVVLFLLGIVTCEQNQQDTDYIWVLFRDKQTSSNIDFKNIQLSPKAFQRRTKAQQHQQTRSLSNNELLYIEDLPVNQEYIDQTLNSCPNVNIQLRSVSRWLNAVSLKIESNSYDNIKGCLEIINKYKFVFKTQHVLRAKKSINNKRNMKREIVTTEDSAHFDKRNTMQIEGIFNYGLSYNQLQQLHIPELHSQGYDGSGVTVVVLDGGFGKLASLVKVENFIGEYDFVNNDNNTSYQPGDDPSQDDHGTEVLSVLAGYANNTLIGAAFNVSILLAKTEDVKTEDIIEEDYFVQGMEWGEAQGADILSASLGYNDWYTRQQIDGSTPISSKAVNIAIQQYGLIAVIAAGNSGENGITVPADSNAIAVGAVNSDGNLARFSSRGPTGDGRLKPDVMATGDGTITASPTYSNPPVVQKAEGTSAATPLISGAIALLLQAHPTWGPQQVMEALINTASNSKNPNNEIGWEIVNVASAILYTPQVCANNCSYPQGECISNQCVCKAEFYQYNCAYEKIPVIFSEGCSLIALGFPFLLMCQIILTMVV